jgi:hypothetical protein
MAWNSPKYSNFKLIMCCRPLPVVQLFSKLYSSRLIIKPGWLQALDISLHCKQFVYIKVPLKMYPCLDWIMIREYELITEAHAQL